MTYQRYLISNKKTDIIYRLNLFSMIQELQDNPALQVPYFKPGERVKRGKDLNRKNMSGTPLGLGTAEVCGVNASAVQSSLR